MTYRTLMFAALPALLTFGVPAATALAQSTVIIAPTAPPAPQVETVPPPPATAMVWQAGHWNWSGTTWVWAPGQYVTPPQQTAVWDPGHWVQQPTGGYVWMAGRWRTSGG